MANHKSATKRALQNEKKRLRNKSIKTKLNNTTRNVKLAIKEKSGTEVATILNKAKSVIAKASTKGVIHKNTASRKISRITRLINRSAA